MSILPSFLQELSDTKTIKEDDSQVVNWTAYRQNSIRIGSYNSMDFDMYAHRKI